MRRRRMRVPEPVVPDRGRSHRVPAPPAEGPRRLSLDRLTYLCGRQDRESCTGNELGARSSAPLPSEEHFRQDGLDRTAVEVGDVARDDQLDAGLAGGRVADRVLEIAQGAGESAAHYAIGDRRDAQLRE